MHTYPKNVPICSEYANFFWLMNYTTFKVITSVTRPGLSGISLSVEFH